MIEIKRTTGEGMGFSLETLERGAIAEIDWHRADLSGRRLEGFSFDGASMRNANLSGVEGGDCSFARANCILASFRGAAFVGGSFEGARLRHADFSGATLRKVNFDGADLTGARFNGADVRDSTFVGAKLADTDLTGCNISESQMRMASSL